MSDRPVKSQHAELLERLKKALRGVKIDLRTGKVQRPVDKGKGGE